MLIALISPLAFTFLGIYILYRLLMLTENQVLVTEIVDGDSYKGITGNGWEMSFRIRGFDAPELDQEHGKVAKMVLKELILGKRIEVRNSKDDLYDRVLGDTYLGSIDIAAFMIEEGHGFEFMANKCRKRELMILQMKAKAKKLGVHAIKNLKKPCDFRKWRRGKK